MLRRSLPLTLATVLFVLCSYVVNVWLGRHLGPSQYGVLGVVTSLVSALNVMQVAGIPQALTKFIAEDETRSGPLLRYATRLQLGLSVVLVVIFVGVSPLLSRMFGEPALVGYVLLGALVLPGYGLLTVFGGYFQGLHLFGRQARLSAVYAIAKIVFIIALADAWGVRGALVGYALAPLAAAVLGRPRAAGRGPLDGRGMAALSRPLIVFAALSLLQYSVDLFFVKGLVHDRASAGYYVAAQSIGVIPVLGLAGLGQVLLPSVARHLGREDRAAAGESARQALRYLLLLQLPVTALLMGSADVLVSALFGARYLPAAGVLRMLLLGYIPVAVFGVLASVLNGAGRAHEAVAVAGLGVLVSFVLCPWWVSVWGLRGAAAGMGAGAFVAAAGAIRQVRRLVPLQLPLLTTSRAAAASLLVLLGASAPVPGLALLVTWPVLLVVYAGVLLALGEVTAHERSQVRALWLTGLRRDG